MGDGCGVRGAGCGVMGAGCGMRGDGCGVRGARCGVRGASFEVGIGMIYEWACLSITADCVEMRAKARF